MASPKEKLDSTKSDDRLDLGSVGIGLMQWGTTSIDDKVVNPKGNLSDQTVRDIWKACRARNINFFDTAEGYGGGTSEIRVRQVRQWYEEENQDSSSKKDNNNNNVIVATKYIPTLWRWTKGAFYKSIHGSLDRLGVQQIDLYFIHTPIHPLPFETFIQWACDAVDDGLIKTIGISNCDAGLTRRAHAVAVKNGKRIECNQIMLNMLVWKSTKHQETVKVCQELGIQIAAYSPIGQGLLTDGLTIEKFQTIRAVKLTGVEYDGDLQPLRQEIQQLSTKYNTTMAQVSMNWVRSHGAIPLVGCRTVQQVEDAAKCQEWTLETKEVEKLNDLSLGLSLFERPKLRRRLFVIIISILQLAYRAEIKYTRFKVFWNQLLFGGSIAATDKQKQPKNE